MQFFTQHPHFASKPEIVVEESCGGMTRLGSPIIDIMVSERMASWQLGTDLRLCRMRLGPHTIVTFIAFEQLRSLVGMKGI